MSKPKTKTEEFTELLSQYPTEEEAKKHIKEIAKKIGVAKSLGYKALKRVKKFQEPTTALPQAEEPTIKIPEIPIEEEEIPEEAPPEEAEEEFIPPEIKEEIPPSPEEPKALPEEVETLRPIFLRSIKRAVNIITTRLQDIPEASLTEEEADDTLTLVNLMLLKYTPIALEKYYLEVTALTHFGTIIADKIIIWRKKKPKEEAEVEEKIREREKAQEPKEEPIEEPKTEPPQLPAELPHLPAKRKASILRK